MSTQKSKAVNSILNSYLEEGNTLNLCINFSECELDSKKIIKIRQDDFSNVSGIVSSLILILPVTNNKFSSITALVKTIDCMNGTNIGKIIFIEDRIPKVQEWIKTELPIFKNMLISNVYDCIGDLCRIEWVSRGV